MLGAISALPSTISTISSFIWGDRLSPVFAAWRTEPQTPVVGRQLPVAEDERPSQAPDPGWARREATEVTFGKDRDADVGRSGTLR